jgi:hypothetical protein
MVRQKIFLYIIGGRKKFPPCPPEGYLSSKSTMYGGNFWGHFVVLDKSTGLRVLGPIPDGREGARADA